MLEANRVTKSSFNIQTGVGEMLCSAHKDSREIRSSVDGLTPPTQLSSDASYWKNKSTAAKTRKRVRDVESNSVKL